MGRILGVDYGEKRIGLAITDEEQKFSFEHDIWDASEFFEKIEPLIIEYDIEKIVLGYPLNMSGEKTKKTAEVLEFKARLEKQIKIPVELLDERLSSKMAAKIAGSDSGIDSLAAQIFLEIYINKKS